jgi:FkbM family methyltransferase
MRVTIGRHSVKGPHGHPLSEIYRNKPTYQFAPWKHVFEIISQTQRKYPLLDIGANIGDSAAHYRIYSDAEIICVEADTTFYSYLEKNARKFGNTTIINALVVDDINHEYEFCAGKGTGHIAEAGERAEIYKGIKIKIADLVTLFGNQACILKTDCDGYDENLLSEAITLIDNKQEFPVIFTEGPSENQMIKSQWHNYNYLIQKLIERDYLVHIYSNHGEFFESTVFPSVVEKYFVELENGLQVQRGICHYFDFIFEKRESTK